MLASHASGYYHASYVYGSDEAITFPAVMREVVVPVPAPAYVYVRESAAILPSLR